MALGVVGYTDKWSVQPSDVITLFVSCEESEFTAQFVRLLRSDDKWSVGQALSRDVESAIDGEWPGAVQAIPLGSFAAIPDVRPPAAEFSISFWIWPTLVSVPGQSVFGLQNDRGWNLSVDIGGKAALELSVADQHGRRRETILADLPERQWSLVVLQIREGLIDARCHVPAYRHDSASMGQATIVGGLPADALTLVLGAGEVDRGDGRAIGRRCYNGKIDEPALHTGLLSDTRILALAGGEKVASSGLAACWDFRIDAGGDRLIDATGSGLDGKVYNRPNRLVTGHRFSARTAVPHDAPDEFGAAHFHEDDLADAQWQNGLSFRIPTDLESGCYAIKLTAGGSVDHVPIFVRPAADATKQRLAVVVPTVSYMVYANSALDESRVADGIAPLNDPTTCAGEREYVRQHRLRSCYDLHADGSGVAFASTRRPMPLFARPNSCSILTGSPHQLAGDLHLIEWLDAKGIAYDIITDHDLHRDGVAALSPYRAVVSGTHAEYWTAPMLDALAAYQQSDGRYIYLSGNGLYWVTALNEDGSVAEINRYRGTRPWSAAPAEEYLSLTGEAGDLWRHRGRAPQLFTGIGFASQGFDVGRPFQRTAQSHDPRVAFAFEGIEEELIGDHPARVCEYGAAGYEIDRADPMLGTPKHALIVASASGFSDSYQRVIEDAQVMAPGNGGQESTDVRADIVFYELPGEGAVFSIGSISYCSALAYDGFRNAASRLLENVVRTFIADGPLPVRPSDAAPPCFP